MHGNTVLLMLFTCRQSEKRQTKSKGHVQWSNRKNQRLFFCVLSELKEAGVVRISTGFGFSALLRRLALWATFCAKTGNTRESTDQAAV